MSATIPAALAAKARTVRRYGWKRDHPDQRDHLFSAHPAILASLPPAVDLRPKCPREVYDQGQLGSCTAHALAAAIEFDLLRQGDPDPFTPSRLFIYFCERVLEGSVPYDNGAQIRDGVKACAAQGYPPEAAWPYSDDGVTFARTPPQPVWDEAAQRKVVAYARVQQTLAQTKGCLAAGYPFVLGFTVYDSFESPAVARTGTANLPSARERVLGGHAVLAVGYDDATLRFTLRNSWGPAWGDGGYFSLPYSYVTAPNLASDFWTLRLVQE